MPPIRSGRRKHVAVQSEYARLAGRSQAAMEPYLPIVRTFVILGPAASPALRERLIQLIEAALRSEDLI